MLTPIYIYLFCPSLLSLQLFSAGGVLEDRASEEAEVLRDCGSNRHNDGGEVWLHEDEHYTLKK